MLLANVQVPQKGYKQLSGVKSGIKSSKSLKNLRSVRQQIHKQEKLRKDMQKAAKINPKAALDSKIKQELEKAFQKLRGNKIHDDLGLLRRAEKRILRKKRKSAENWEKRKEDVKLNQVERQQKRTENIEMFRKSKKNKPAPSASDSAKSDGSSKKMSRKMRRHANLMKYGPKKTREDREKKRKDFRKEQKKSRSTHKSGPRK